MTHRNTDGQPAIFAIITYGNVEVVKKLLKRGAVSRASVVEEVNPKPQLTPLTEVRSAPLG